MGSFTHIAVVFDFQDGVPKKPVSWGVVKHHFDDNFLANKGIDF